MKQRVILAHTHAASHDFRAGSSAYGRAAFAEAQTIPRPARAGKNLTANSLHPSSFIAMTESHQNPIDLPDAKDSPILGTK